MWRICFVQIPHIVNAVQVKKSGKIFGVLVIYPDYFIGGLWVNLLDKGYMFRMPLYNKV